VKYVLFLKKRHTYTYVQQHAGVSRSRDRRRMQVRGSYLRLWNGWHA